MTLLTLSIDAVCLLSIWKSHGVMYIGEGSLCSVWISAIYDVVLDRVRCNELVVLLSRMSDELQCHHFI